MKLIKYPQNINEIAVLIGGLRAKSNAELKNRKAEYQRGGLDIHVDVLGVKGELIVHSYLFSIGERFTFAPLFSTNPVMEPDIVIGENRFDIKAIGQKNPYFMVNEKAHNKNKGANYYWFVKPISDHEAQYRVFSYADVGQWEIRKFRFSPVYCKKIAEKKVNQK